MKFFSKLLNFSDHAAFNRVWLAVNVVLLVCLLILLVFFALQIKKLKSNDDASRQNIASLQATLYTVFDEHRNSDETLMKKLTAQDQLMRQLSASIQAISNDIDQLKSSHTIYQQEASSLSSRYKTVADIILDYTKSDFQMALPFSYYRSDSWENIANNIAIIIDSPSSFKTEHLQGKPVHTFNIADAKDWAIDSRIYSRLNFFITKNGVPNVIKVSAPGLASTENSDLKIIADKGIDRIDLDGCLSWEKLAPEGDYNLWQAKDVNGEARTIKIALEVTVSIQEKCDTRYLMNYKLQELSRNISRDKGVSLAAGTNLESTFYDPFGGIGLVLESENNAEGIKVKSVIRDKPAHKAGIKTSDVIVRINGQSVLDMNRSEAIEKMRGQVGSEVQLSYIPYSRHDSAVVHITLVRELIDSTDLYRHHGSPDDLVWQVSNEDKKFIVTPASITEGKNIKVYTALNTGKEVIPPRNLKVMDKDGREKESWKILPESTCSSGDVLPGKTCTVIVKADPVMDGQMRGVISITGQREHPSNPENLALIGYSRGIAGKLPEGVLGNGDLCPVAGESAEIAISSNGKFDLSDGYFNTEEAQHDNRIKLYTAECDKWQLDVHQRLYCNNPGYNYRVDTAREYHSQSIEGPWSQPILKEKFLSVRITCREGLIEQVDWDW